MSLSIMTRAAMAAFAISLAAPAAMAQSTMAPSGSMAPMKTTTMTTKTVTKPMAATAGKLGASQKFTTVAAAQATCPSDTVVWSSFTSTHSFHLSTSKYFGKTKHGAYVCEQAATAAGYHQSKT